MLLGGLSRLTLGLAAHGAKRSASGPRFFAAELQPLVKVLTPGKSALSK